MKELLEFLKGTLDRTQLWLWLALAAASLTAVNLFTAARVSTLSEYGLIATFVFAALFFQSAPIHGAIAAWFKKQRDLRAERKSQTKRLKYVLAVPCREHVMLVAYHELFGAALASRSTVPISVVRPMFFDELNSPTREARYLVEQGFAQPDTSSGDPLIHQWVYRAVHQELSAPASNECKVTLDRLQRFGLRLFAATEWSALFVHSVHKETMLRLEGEA